jgi:hypothetical protein
MTNFFAYFFLVDKYSQPLATQAGIGILKKGGNAAVSIEN